MLSLLSDFSFVNAYPVFDVLFIFFMAGLLYACVKELRSEGLQEGLIAFSVLVVFVSLVVDMLSAHEIITWIGRTAQWGLVLFTVALLGVYLVQDRQQQASLERLSSSLEQLVNERTKELNESRTRFEKLAQVDYLTGLLNRRAFMELATKEVVSAVRHERPLSLMLFDIDYFKQINDEYGHDKGDRVLVEVSQTVLKICRESDLVCRWGGEEFVVLLPSTEPENAKRLAERLREGIELLDVTTNDGGSLKTTASFGFISYSGYREVSELNNPANADKLLHLLLSKADSAMYQTKSKGRNDITAVVL